MKIAIVEDDSFIRRELASLITAVDGHEIAGVFSEGERFLSQVQMIRPDVLLLDIGLPGISGIQVAEYIRRDYPFMDIVFITADEQRVRDAFRLYAVDFITKPLDTDRLYQTIRRINDKYLTSESKIELKCKDSLELIDQKTIYFVEASMKKCIVYTGDHSLTCLHSLRDMEEKMDMNMFFKSSRSFLVNLNLVQSAKTYSRNSYQIIFRGIDSCAYLQNNLYSEFRARIKNLDSKG